jgi:hypothetical protein
LEKSSGRLVPLSISRSIENLDPTLPLFKRFCVSPLLFVFVAAFFVINFVVVVVVVIDAFFITNFVIVVIYCCFVVTNFVVVVIYYCFCCYCNLLLPSFIYYYHLLFLQILIIILLYC